MSRGGGMHEGLLPSHALGSIQPPDFEPTAIEDGPCWRLAHVLGLCTGAVSFLLGSVLLFKQIREREHLFDGSSDSSGDGSAAAAELTMVSLQSAWLYIVGSLGFCFVDVQELVAFASTRRRVGIAGSLLGSVAYVVGAVGHLDAVFAITPLIGTLGFLVGATVSSCAHACKLCKKRLVNCMPPPRWRLVPLEHTSIRAYPRACARSPATYGV